MYKICLCFIANSNEKDIMTTFLSFKGVISHYLIYSVPSTIKNSIDKYNQNVIYGSYYCKTIGGIKTHMVNTGLAMDNIDYILVVDCGDKLEGIITFDKLVNSIYCLKYNKNGTTYDHYPTLFKTKSAINIEYIGNIHTYFKTDSNIDICILGIEQDYYISKNNDHLNNSIDIDDVYTCFLLANKYYDQQNYLVAKNMYTKLTLCEDLPIYILYACKMGIARCLDRLGNDWLVIKECYINAYNCDKRRAEPLYCIGRYYRDNNNYQKCYEYCKQGAQLSKNIMGFEIDYDVYDYKMLDEMCIVTFSMEYYEKNIIYTKYMLENSKNDDEGLVANLEFAKSCINGCKKLVLIYTVPNYKNITFLDELISRLSDIYNVVIVNGYLSHRDYVTIDEEYLYSYVEINKVHIIIVVDDTSFFDRYQISCDKIYYIILNTVYGQYNFFEYHNSRLNNYFSVDYINNKILSNINKIICYDEITVDAIMTQYGIPEHKIYMLSKHCKKREFYDFLDDDVNSCNDNYNINDRLTIICTCNMYHLINVAKTDEFMKKIVLAKIQEIESMFPDQDIMFIKYMYAKVYRKWLNFADALDILNKWLDKCTDSSVKIDMAKCKIGVLLDQQNYEDCLQCMKEYKLWDKADKVLPYIKDTELMTPEIILDNEGTVFIYFVYYNSEYILRTVNSFLCYNNKHIRSYNILCVSIDDNINILKTKYPFINIIKITTLRYSGLLTKISKILSTIDNIKYVGIIGDNYQFVDKVDIDGFINTDADKIYCNTLDYCQPDYVLTPALYKICNLVKPVNVIYNESNTYVCLDTNQIKEDIELTIHMVYNQYTTHKHILDGINVIDHDIKTEIPLDMIKTVFKNNDFYYRQDVIKLWLKHIDIYRSTEKYSIIVDSRSDLTDDFIDGLDYAIYQLLKDDDIDIIVFDQEGIADTNYLNKTDIICNKDMGIYIITHKGSQKVLEYMDKHGIKGMFGKYMSNIEGLNVHRLNMFIADGYTLDPINIDIEGYDFYSGMDTYGYDIRCCGKLSTYTLKEICDNDNMCMGFNTLGYIKYNVKPLEDMCYLYSDNRDNYEGIYVKKVDSIINHKISVLTDKKHNPDKYEQSNITFTVTTCKRWKLFKQTMKRLLVFCSDIEIVDKWLCVDDNSSDSDRCKMKSMFPFFEYVDKSYEERGHAKSMNIIWDRVTTDYVMHFEDDWICNKQFRLKPLLDYIKNNNVDQLILRKISWRDHDIVRTVDTNRVYKYMYNPNHCIKPGNYRQYDVTHNFLKVSDYPNDIYWWWPGFTLNPSIFNISKIRGVGKFDEEVVPDVFEYDYSVRCNKYGVIVHYTDMNIDHTGKVSSYTLNDTKRHYD